MSALRLALACATAAMACSVPALSLDGKQCPCTDGYVCDELTNRCLAVNDGGMIIDTPAATQCLPSTPTEAELYRYAGTFDWQHGDASWTGNATEITQSSSSAQDSYAYRVQADLTSNPNVRVIATMRETSPGSGSPSLGIVLRAQLSPQDKDRYTCSWSSKDLQLRLELQGGGSSTILAAAAVSPGATLPAQLTMEAAVDGFTLGCCIRELPDARLMTVADPGMTVEAGYPGLETTRMAAAFGSFVVFRR